MAFVVLCYPKCSTCAKALKYMENNGCTYDYRNIQTDNPTREELAAFYKKSRLPLKRFWNTSGEKYRALGMKDKLPSMTEEEQMDLLSTDGLLVRRPILVADDFVLVGFKEEAWHDKLVKATE